MVVSDHWSDWLFFCYASTVTKTKTKTNTVEVIIRWSGLTDCLCALPQQTKTKTKMTNTAEIIIGWSAGLTDYFSALP